jgi:hypothetical protein
MLQRKPSDLLLCIVNLCHRKAMNDLRFRKKGKVTNVVMMTAEPNTERTEVDRVATTRAKPCHGVTFVCSNMSRAGGG